MRNERLREAIAGLGIKITDLGPMVGVNSKTAQRWIYEGRQPRRSTAERVAKFFGLPVDWLWPHIDGDDHRVPTELVRMYPHRLDVPRQLWQELIRDTHSQIDILAVAGLFLIEDNPAIVGLLKCKANEGVQIRIALTDPDSAAIRRRAGEQMLYDTLVHRAEVARDTYDPLFSAVSVQYRPHTATVYSTIVRCDDQMLVNHHLYGIYGHLAPLLHLQRAQDGGLFDLFRTSFDRVWHTSGSPIL